MRVRPYIWVFLGATLGMALMMILAVYLKDPHPTQIFADAAVVCILLVLLTPLPGSSLVYPGLLDAALSPFWQFLPEDDQRHLLAWILRRAVKRQARLERESARLFQKFKAHFVADPQDPRPVCEQVWAAWKTLPLPYLGQQIREGYFPARKAAILQAHSRIEQIGQGMPACSSSREARIYMLARLCVLAMGLEDLEDAILKQELAVPLAASAQALQVGAHQDPALTLAALSRAGGGRAHLKGWCNPAVYSVEFLAALLEARKMLTSLPWDAAVEELINRDRAK